MNYEEALEYYKNLNLNLESINQLLSDSSLTYNQHKALETIASEITEKQDNNTFQSNMKAVEEYAESSNTLDDLYDVLFKIENNTRTIKSILQFVLILSFIAAFIMIIALATNR